MKFKPKMSRVVTSRRPPKKNLPRWIKKRKGRYWNRKGYEVIWTLKGWRLLHRVIVEEVLGRGLKKNEEVHHIDGDKKNNENRNLLVCSRRYHQGLHRRCLARYGNWHLSA